jgi:hypothetical protein
VGFRASVTTTAGIELLISRVFAITVCFRESHWSGCFSDIEQQDDIYDEPYSGFQMNEKT